MIELVKPEILIIFILLAGSINLVTPFISKDDNVIRNILLISVSIFFIINIIFLDFVYFNGVYGHLDIIQIGKFSITLDLEPIGMVFINLLAVLWLCALLYTIKFLAINSINNSHRFLFFMNCCVLLGIFVALSANLFTMFIGYELLTLSTIPLITHYQNKVTAKGLFKYLKILMLSALILFLPAILIIQNVTDNNGFIYGGFVKGYFSKNQTIILLLMFVFGIAKAALYPFHKWLPAAMVAPYPVSALLHAVVVVKTGLFCIYKILAYVFGISYLHSIFYGNNWLILLPIITIIYSSLQALRYTKIKMMLAYSTINQLSIALLSAFLLTPKGLIAAITHMVSHSFTKICIFYTAGNMYSVKNAYDIKDLVGIKTTMPKSSFVLAIAGLSLIGLPPFAGFISKMYIMLAAAEQENFVVMFTLMISSLMSAVYVLKMVIFIYRPTTDNFILNLKLKPFFDEPKRNKSSKKIISEKHQAERKLPAFMIISILLCLTGVVGFFLIQQLISKFLQYI